MAEEKTQRQSKQAPCCFVACTPRPPPVLPSQCCSNTVDNGGGKGLPSSTPKMINAVLMDKHQHQHCQQHVVDNHNHHHQTHNQKAPHI
eukprot:12540629-Ditylum_brightwellii.AAC.1